MKRINFADITKQYVCTAKNRIKHKTIKIIKDEKNNLRRGILASACK